MVEELKIRQALTVDLLRRSMHPDEEVREAAIEALAVTTEADDWRPNELIRQGGVAILIGLLEEENPHIVAAAIKVLTATAAAGHEEEVLSGGGIASMYQMRDHPDPAVRRRVREALWLLEPEVEESIVEKPHDNY